MHALSIEPHFWFPCLHHWLCVKQDGAMRTALNALLEINPLASFAPTRALSPRQVSCRVGFDEVANCFHGDADIGLHGFR